MIGFETIVNFSLVALLAIALVGASVGVLALGLVKFWQIVEGWFE